MHLACFIRVEFLGFVIHISNSQEMNGSCREIGLDFPPEIYYLLWTEPLEKIYTLLLKPAPRITVKRSILLKGIFRKNYVGKILTVTLSKFKIIFRRSPEFCAEIDTCEVT